MGLAYRGEYANHNSIELELDRLDARLSRQYASLAFPVGAGCLWFSDTPPNTDWILCQGQGLRQVEYPDLYRVWGTTYGGGSDAGVTQFSVPDLRTKYPRGNAGTGTASTLATVGTFAAVGSTASYLVVNFAVRAR